MEEKEFKKYYLQDYVMAKPMSENEARRFFGESPEQFSKPGYLVEYSNGNKSWISKADFEEVSRIADSFVDRMKIEEDDLNQKRKKLLAFLHKDEHKKLTRGERALLLAQNFHMFYYEHLLHQRMNVAQKETDTAKQIEISSVRYTFFDAVCLMKESFCVGRENWGPMKFITFLIPCEVGEKCIDDINNLNTVAKYFIKNSICKRIVYRNQAILYDMLTGVATNYSPSMDDVESDDWIVYDAKDLRDFHESFVKKMKFTK
jgi:hypothetical protein